MPLFEINKGELVPFRRVVGGPDLYESEIETLVWENIEEFTGEALFKVKRQAKLPTGGIADIVALDKTGRVVVFEIKRDIDRKQLAQCLEYAGWARSASLDELAGLFFEGPEAFFTAWSDANEAGTPTVVNPHPRLVLVARDFEGRTEAAFDFLVESGVPVQLIRVSLYEDEDGRRFVDVEGEHEPLFRVDGETEKDLGYTRFDGRPVRLADLIEHGVVEVGDALVWDRPVLGDTHRATVAANGAITLEDGRSFSSPSRAATEAADIPAYDGWHAWAVVRLGKKLNEVRRDFVMKRRTHDE